MTQARQAPASAPPTTPLAPPAPGGAAPGAAGQPAPNFVTPAHLSSGDVASIRARVSELADQLKAATTRRQDVQRSLIRASTPADRAGLEQRLGVLDARIARIESDIDVAGQQLSSYAGVVPPLGRGPRFGNNVDMTPVLVCFVLFVLSPIAVALSRFLWKRSSTPRAAVNPENNERMVRMEHAIDSIAIEIERVSEGQRFVTRLLAEGTTPAQVAGAAQAQAQAVRSSS